MMQPREIADQMAAEFKKIDDASPTPGDKDLPAQERRTPHETLADILQDPSFNEGQTALDALCRMQGAKEALALLQGEVQRYVRERMKELGIKLGNDGSM